MTALVPLAGAAALVLLTAWGKVTETGVRALVVITVAWTCVALVAAGSWPRTSATSRNATSRRSFRHFSSASRHGAPVGSGRSAERQSGARASSGSWSQ